MDPTRTEALDSPRLIGKEPAAMAELSESTRPARPRRRYLASSPGPRTGWDHDAEMQTLKALWERQKLEDTISGIHGADLAYAAAHFEMDLTLRRRLRVLDQIAGHLPDRGRVFEWGCQHAIDSCIYRLRFGDRLELHGADLYEPGPFHVFHEFSGLLYKKLDHPVFMPYPDNFFDAITSNGVLEHVDDDATSLYEVFRILRPGGLFLISCLPNRLSYTEALQRLLGHNAHDRLYSISSATSLLTPPGFEVIDAGFAFMLPTMLYGFPRWAKTAFNRLDRPLHALNAILERLWPLKLLASNLWLIARKPIPTRDGQKKT